MTDASSEANIHVEESTVSKKLKEPAILRSENPVAEEPPGTIVDVVYQQAATRGEHVFIEFVDSDPSGSGVQHEKVTYREFADQAQRISRLLATQGVTPGARVGILMANSPRWLASYIGVLGVGAVAVPINSEFTANEAEYYVSHARVSTVIYGSQFVELAQELESRCPDLSQIVDIDSIDFEAEMSEGDPFADRRNVDELALVIYTSGTSTGRPKGVMLSHRNLFVGPFEFSREIGVRDDDRIMFATPLHHANALVYAFGSALIHGASSHFVSRFSASRFWTDVEQLRPTILWTMGGILSILMSREETPEEVRARRHLRMFFGAGVANQFEEAQRRIAPVVMDCYGLSETAGGTYTPIDGTHVIDVVNPAVGLPLRHTQIGIMDDEDNLLPYDELGEIVFYDLGGNIMIGYLDDEEAQNEAVRDNWFHTGDLGFISSTDGFLHFVDRKKDIVRRGGVNISSQEIEGVLREHPEVGDCAVVPAPDPVLGEVVKLYVIPSGDDVDIEALLEFARAQLSKHKVPEIVEVRQELPRTGTGKIEKFALRRETREGSAHEWRPM